MAFDAAESSRATAVTAAGDAGVLVAGSFAGEMRLAGRAIHGRGASDLFVARIRAGEADWLATLSGPGHPLVRAIAVGPAGRVAIAGSFDDRLALDRSQRPIAGRGRDGFVALFEPDGRLRWHAVLPGQGALSRVELADVDVTEAGRVVVAGSFRGTVSVGEISLTSAGGSDALIAAFDSSGGAGWARRAGGPASDHAHALTASGDRIYVAGSFARIADFAGAELRTNHNQDGYLASLSADGTVHWVNTFGGADRDLALAVAATAEVVAVAGTFTGSSASFGTGELAAGQDAAAYVAAYSRDGEPAWSRRLGTRVADARALAALPSGELAIAGTFEGRQSIADTAVDAAGARDVYVAIYGPDGTGRVAYQLGGEGHDDATSITTAGGLLVIAGTFSSELGPLRADRPTGFAAALRR